MQYSGPVTPVGDRSSGRALRDYMRAHKVSRGELSRRTGITLKTVSAICDGKREGNMSTWRAFAKALRCSISDIAEV